MRLMVSDRHAVSIKLDFVSVIMASLRLSCASANAALLLSIVLLQ
jgi:hypothetical protein